jgi:hypothetical protein
MEKPQVVTTISGGVDADSVKDSAQVVGSTELYQDDGQIRYIPMPTPDPKGEEQRT